MFSLAIVAFALAVPGTPRLRTGSIVPGSVGAACRAAATIAPGYGWFLLCFSFGGASGAI